MDELTRPMQDEVPFYMLFEDDIVLVDETKHGVDTNLGIQRDTLESKSLRYMEYKSNTRRNKDGEVVKFDVLEIPNSK